MSQEDLTQFLEAVRQDPSLQEKLRAEGADPVAIAREAGFSVTQAELVRAHARHLQTLSDEELENVAAGLVTNEGLMANRPYLSTNRCGDSVTWSVRNYQCRESSGLYY